MMTLYDNAASPYCRKVRMVLALTDQTDAVALVDAAGHPTDAGTLPVAQNPLGKIPVLVRDDGPALVDSRVICRFLDHRANGDLYPDTRLWETLTLEALGDGIMDAALAMVYEGRSRPEDKMYAPWVDGQWAKIARTLDGLEARWMSHLSGPVSIAQVAIGAALGYLDLRLYERAWRDGRPELAAWHARFAATPAMADTAP